MRVQIQQIFIEKNYVNKKKKNSRSVRMANKFVF